jgi:hypothetical protein
MSQTPFTQGSTGDKENEGNKQENVGAIEDIASPTQVIMLNICLTYQDINKPSEEGTAL